MPQAVSARQRRHEAILDAAARCFVRDGVEGTTMDAIAAEAGVSRATVFNHVATKRALLAALYDRQLARLDARLTAAPPDGRFEHQVDAFFRIAEGVLRDDGALTPLLIREVLHDPVLLERDLTHGHAARRVLTTIVTTARRDGRLRRSVPVAEVVGLFMDCWSATLIPWAAAGGRAPLARQVRRKIRLVLRGLAAP